MPYVADTHALAWHMTDSPSLSERAKKILCEEEIVIPCIVLFELLYLVEKKRLSEGFEHFVSKVAASTNYRIEPLCLPIIEKSRSIPRETVPDPWDRLIGATSMHLGLPLISRDQSLKEAGIEVVW